MTTTPDALPRRVFYCFQSVSDDIRLPDITASPLFQEANKKGPLLEGPFKPTVSDQAAGCMFFEPRHKRPGPCRLRTKPGKSFSLRPSSQARS